MRFFKNLYRLGQTTDDCRVEEIIPLILFGFVMENVDFTDDSKTRKL